MDKFDFLSRLILANQITKDQLYEIFEIQQVGFYLSLYMVLENKSYKEIEKVSNLSEEDLKGYITTKYLCKF